MAGTKGLGAGAGSAAFSAWGAGSGFAVSEAGAWPRALVGVRYTVSLGGQMGWTLSATRAPIFHSVFHVGRTGCGRKAGWAALGGWAGAGDLTTVGVGVGLTPWSRYALASMD